MTIVNVHEAKTHLSRLLERVEQGEEITIARNNRPIARLVAHVSPRRRPGSLRGRVQIHEDFDEPLPDEVAEAFGADERATEDDVTDRSRVVGDQNS